MNQDIVTIQGIECYEVEGTAWLKLETVARGLDITKTDRKENAEYKRVNRQALQKWLFSFGILNSENDELPEFIPENVFYRLAMKARNETAEQFQALIADEIIPAIRKHGAYVAPNAQPQGLETFAAALETLTTAVQTLTQRLDQQEQNPRRRALPPPQALDDDNPFADYPVPIKPPSNKARRNWMRTASEKLNALADKCGIPSSSVLHSLYQELEEEQGVILSEVRLKALEEHQLTDCSILLAIFYDTTLRRWFEKRVDQYLSAGTPAW